MKIKLFCIPYAGGTSAFYTSWRPYLSPNLELIPIELAGKGKRLGEPLYPDMDTAVQDVFERIKGEITEAPYLIFGHSMGSKITYKVCQKLQRQGLPAPMHIFLSGSGAPHFKPEDEKVYHLMEDETFRQEVINLGGTPREFFDHPELVEIFLPALKNDFAILETAVYEPTIAPIACDISALFGKEDALTPEEREGWQHYSTQRCTFHYYEGGHFFLLDEAKAVIHLINLVAANKTILQ